MYQELMMKMLVTKITYGQAVLIKFQLGLELLFVDFGIFCSIQSQDWQLPIYYFLKISLGT